MVVIKSLVALGSALSYNKWSIANEGKTQVISKYADQVEHSVIVTISQQISAKVSC